MLWSGSGDNGDRGLFVRTVTVTAAHERRHGSATPLPVPRVLLIWGYAYRVVEGAGFGRLR